jgi:hypothetical protein
MEEISAITTPPPISATAHFPRESPTGFPTHDVTTGVPLAFTTVARRMTP